MKENNFVSVFNDFLISKKLTEEEAQIILRDVFSKAFEKDKDALSNYENGEIENPEPAVVKVEFEITTGKIIVKRILEVVEEKTIVSRFKQIEFSNEKIKDLNLSIGDNYEEIIDFSKIDNTKILHIKQLFLQKLSEFEKKKVFQKFSKFKGELLNAKIHKIIKKGSVILDYDGNSIFMPANEISPLDKDKIFVGNTLTIYVLEISELSKDAQIIASRRSPKFIEKLIEREIDDVQDGVVIIESIAREIGFKTKIAVSTTDINVEPVGSIIGFKGGKIKPILDELGGERVDVIKYHSDIKQFIAESLLPAEVRGIKINKIEESNKFYDWESKVIVDDKDFLPALGKRGINIKLAAILTRTKIDVKTVDMAREEGIIWEPIVKERFSKPERVNSVINTDDYENYVEEMEEYDDIESNFSDSDYDFNENFTLRNNNNSMENSDENYYNPDEEEEEFE